MSLSNGRKAELLAQLQALQDLSNLYYEKSRAIGIHSLIEHTGLINEHLQILRRAVHEEAVDVAELNVHCGLTVRVQPFEVLYLAEKFSCMFVPLFRDANAWNQFRTEAERQGCGKGNI